MHKRKERLIFGFEKHMLLPDQYPKAGENISRIFCIQIYYAPNSIFLIRRLILVKDKCRTRIYSLKVFLQLQPEFLNILNQDFYLYYMISN